MHRQERSFSERTEMKDKRGAKLCHCIYVTWGSGAARCKFLKDRKGSMAMRVHVQLPLPSFICMYREPRHTCAPFATKAMTLPIIQKDFYMLQGTFMSPAVLSFTSSFNTGIYVNVTQPGPQKYQIY